MTTLFLLTDPRFAKKDKKLNQPPNFSLPATVLLFFYAHEDFTPPDAYGPPECETPETDFLEKITI